MNKSNGAIDPYDVLQVPCNASEREIKMAYKKMALLNHPDRAKNSPGGGSEDNKAKMAAINEAYSILKDEDRKLHYDLSQPFRNVNMTSIPRPRRHTSQFASSTNTSSTSSNISGLHRTSASRMAGFDRKKKNRPGDIGQRSSSRFGGFPADPFEGRSMRNGLSSSSSARKKQGFTFKYSSVSKETVNSSGERSYVRTTNMYRNGKKETCIETARVFPDGSQQTETNFTSEDYSLNPLDNLFGSVWSQTKKWIGMDGSDDNIHEDNAAINNEMKEGRDDVPDTPASNEEKHSGSRRLRKRKGIFQTKKKTESSSMKSGVAASSLNPMTAAGEETQAEEETDSRESSSLFSCSDNLGCSPLCATCV
uniref:J domain-containing protein n=1 Tax=Chaetoceros debilis TaxID=122233 RepID=A0A7S3PVE9_9STRA|mmetsp:Transcript_20028/g.30319  ORF Transcript_20028/g.30319 Transcript_20028/m.30319 type:complete len:365 (+) Transcript_20028:520-1614(+)|eukprot:CAMPEP_0194084540 /NCGR_PEP_ID=MMETSP0149-20130528/13772_1 /TAXON_ID=122233 /ORGANISM="Chaetoceros debilis, Strain MM31A-1" /LENGTH=364 /DNA_ID=CAMNT_0038767219 /DNA_START=475 /DNA_END=1569 /DNA_ORIENTATION=+